MVNVRYRDIRMDITCSCIFIAIFEWVLSGKESLDYIHVTTNNWFNCETKWGEKKIWSLNDRLKCKYLHIFQISIFFYSKFGKKLKQFLFWRRECYFCDGKDLVIWPEGIEYTLILGKSIFPLFHRKMPASHLYDLEEFTLPIWTLFSFFIKLAML